MPSKKVYFGLFLILAVFFLIMFSAFGIQNIRQGNLESILIVGDNTTWTYKDRRWGNVRYTSSLQQINWTKFHVFEDNQELGDYYLWHDDKWYVFDDDKQAINVSGKLLAYSGNYHVKVLDFQESTVDDYSYVYSVLQENGLSTSSLFSSIYKVDIDYDGDSNIEEFYIISNQFPLDFEADTTFSIAFMVKNNMIYYLYNDIHTTQGLNGCKPYYHSFVDTDSDGVYEVIISCGKYSSEEPIDMLFQFKEGAFKLLISNQ